MIGLNRTFVCLTNGSVAGSKSFCPQIIASNVPRSDVLEQIVRDDVLKFVYVSIVIRQESRVH